MNQDSNIFVVYDRNVERLATEIAPGRPHYAICADEEHKNMDTVMGICRWLLECGADRSATVYAVGGGVTTDMAGFAACIYKRGVRYVNYPTTLLAQVDAGIGGKTGVNLDGYKNILGVIEFPMETRIIPESLETLPERELRSGAAELLKTFIIENRDDKYARAVTALSREKIDFAELGPLISAAADVKRRIVEEDPHEKGLRRVLNLGHSYGHAIEWYQRTHECDAGQHDFSHGEAVAMGIIHAAKISMALGKCDAGLVERLERDFKACKLPTSLPYPEDELRAALWKDKKVEGSHIHFVLIKDIGNVLIEELDDLHLYTK